MEEPTAKIPRTIVLPGVQNASAAPEAQIRLTTQPETTLQDVSHAMQGSDPSPRAEKDVASGFWSTYERVAKQHDDEFIERQNGDLDSLLIFAGLFSSVSSAFIVNMESNLSPQPSDTTNALLKVLINKIDNGTFSEQEASLPMWKGPSTAIIWIQSLVYTSLSLSLLAAFGGVLGKQWLGHFKTSRFGQGTLRERCTQRQRKVDGLMTWNLNIIIAILPILLQLSLSFFGIALAANIWTLQHTVAGVIMGTSSLGVIFYFFTVIASLKSPDCPFQTPVSTILNHFLYAVRETIMAWARRVISMSWDSFLRDLQALLRGVFNSAKNIITRSIARFLAYRRKIFLTLWPPTVPPTDDPESSGVLNESVSLEEIALEPFAARSIQWLLETSTDMDIITTAVQMVPEVEWPDGHDVTFVLNHLTSQLHAYVDSPWQLTPHTRKREQTCLKAIFHLYTERDLRGPLNIWHRDLRYNDHHLRAMPNEQDFQLILCVIERPYDLDITSLPFSDRMWMAHILTYKLYNGDQPSSVLIFVRGFIDKCLRDPKSPPRLVADCLLLAGLMVGLRPHRRALATIDKSAAIRSLQQLDRILHLLLGEAPVSPIGYTLQARKLLQPLAYSKHGQDCEHYQRSVQCLKLCFCLLEDPSTVGDQVQFTNVAAALRLSHVYSTMVEESKVWTFLYRTGPEKSRPYWGGPPSWHTQAQFDLLVDYLLSVSQGTDYTAIGDAFAVLAGLRGSPSTLERKRLYIQTMIHCMESEIPRRTRYAALSAAYALRTDVASMDRDDEPLRYIFSRALISVMGVRDPAMQQHTNTSVNDIPFIELSDINWRRNLCYLGLVCALSTEPTWQGHFDRHGHFKSCLAIADSLSSQFRTVVPKALAVHLTHTFAIIDARGEDHKFLRVVQTYPIWPIILLAWLDMFWEPFFYDATVENWEELSSWGVVESLPSVAAYAMKYWERWDNKAETHRLILLVEQVCDKLDEEKRRGEKNIAPVKRGQENDTFGHQGIPSLSKRIRQLVIVLRRDRSR